MRSILAVIILAAGCARRPGTVVAPAPVAVSRPARTFLAPAAPPARIDVTVPWVYPEGIVASNYCWMLQTSVDLTNWADVTGCVGLTETGPTNERAFFRLKGTRGD